MTDDEDRLTVTFEDRRGNVLVADLHEDRASMMIGAQGLDDDALHTAWLHLTPDQAIKLAQALFRQFG
jgi:hypothetical protein